jgi:hypothetical protein
MATEFTQQHRAIQPLSPNRLARPWMLALNQSMFMLSTMLVSRLSTESLALRCCTQSGLCALILRFP